MSCCRRQRSIRPHRMVFDSEQCLGAFYIRAFSAGAVATRYNTQRAARYARIYSIN